MPGLCRLMPQATFTLGPITVATPDYPIEPLGRPFLFVEGVLEVKDVDRIFEAGISRPGTEEKAGVQPQLTGYGVCRSSGIDSCCQYPNSGTPSAPVLYRPIWPTPENSKDPKSRLATKTSDGWINNISSSSRPNISAEGIHRSSAFPRWPDQSSYRIKQACHYFTTFPWLGVLSRKHNIGCDFNFLRCTSSTRPYIVVTK